MRRSNSAASCGCAFCTRRISCSSVLGGFALVLRIPTGIDVGGISNGGAVQPRFRGSQRLRHRRARAVAVVASAQIRRAETDHSLAADHARLVVDRAGFLNGLLDSVGIVTVDIGDHVPAVGFETLRRIVGEPAFDVTVDGMPLSS